MKKSLGLFVALAFTPFFSLSFALLHGSVFFLDSINSSIMVVTAHG